MKKMRLNYGNYPSFSKQMQAGFKPADSCQTGN